MKEFQIIEVATAALNTQRAAIDEASRRIALANSKGNAGFSVHVDESSNPSAASVHIPYHPVADITTIMMAGRLYETNTAVIAAVRSSFEKALEITRGRG